MCKLYCKYQLKSFLIKEVGHRAPNPDLDCSCLPSRTLYTIFVFLFMKTKVTQWMGEGQAKQSNRGLARSVGLGDPELREWHCDGVLQVSSCSDGHRDHLLCLQQALGSYFAPVSLFSFILLQSYGVPVACLPTSGEEGPDLWWLSVG